MLNGENRKGRRWGIGIGCLVLSTFFWCAVKGDGAIAEEHGTMENLQAICLATGVLLLWVQAWKASDLTKQALALAGLGYFTMLLLEFDVRPFKVAWLTEFLSGPIRNLWLGAAWVCCLGWAAKDLSKIMHQARAWARGATGAVLTASAIFWIAGSVFEDLKLCSHKENLFIEELMETNAALLMLWAALEITMDAPGKGVIRTKGSWPPRTPPA